MLVYIMLAS